MKKRTAATLLLVFVSSAMLSLGCSKERKLDTSEESTTGAQLSPLDQSNDADDLATSAELRKALVQDPTLSFDAKNVHVITRGGVITLRGAVKNETERATIEFAARQTPGAVRVDNQLVIEPSRGAEK
jgi:osmotically-inducible protein OsmY